MSQPTGVRQAFSLPLGRIVSGNPTFKQDKDQQGNLKKSPNWWMMVACPKDNNPQGPINHVLQTIMGVAFNGYRAYPDILQRIQGGLASGFKWKIEDGDHPDNRDKEGRAGCWLIKFSTNLGVMQCCDVNGNLIDPALVKTGYYVQVSGNADINGNKDHTAGVYINPVWVKLIATAQEIRSGLTPQEAFANAAPVGQLPPGAAPFVAGGAPGQFAGNAGAGHTPAGNAALPSPGAFASGAPAPGFAQNPPPPPPPPPPPAPVYETAEQVAAKYRVQHHPGHRYDPASNTYVPDTAPPPPPPPAAPVHGQAAGGFPAQGAGGFPAGSTAAQPFQATVSPGDAFPGAQPHAGFLTGQPAGR